MRKSESTAALALPEGVIHLAACRLGPPLAHICAPLAAGSGESPATWRARHDRLAAKLADLVGAAGEDVVLGESLPVLMLQAMSAAVSLCAGPARHIILTDDHMPPEQLHLLAGIAETLGRKLRVVAPHCLCYALTDEVALLVLSPTDPQTGKRRDMACFSRQAHEAGALTLWDLSEAVGALPVDLAGDGADFAVGATDRHLLGGLGAPPFLWTAPRFAKRARPAIPAPLPVAGPAGHAFDRMATGLPHPAAMLGLERALAFRGGLSPEAYRVAATKLGQAFLSAVRDQCPEIGIETPPDPEERGGHISLRHPKAAPLAQELAARGIVADLHGSELLRFAFSPLYNHLPDVDRAVTALRQALFPPSPPISQAEPQPEPEPEHSTRPPTHRPSPHKG